MLRTSLHTAVSSTKWHLRTSAASDRASCVTRTVNELQAASGTTTTGRIVNKICSHLANDRATTRTEQLIWLAKHSLDTAACKDTGGHGKEVAVEERPKMSEDKTTRATSESNSRQP